MKMNTIEVIRLVNAGGMLVFSMSYSFYLNDYYRGFGILFWVFALPFLYFPDLIRSPGVSKEVIRDSKKLSILVGWFIVVFWWGLESKNNSLIILGSMLFILITAYFIFYIKKWKNVDLYRK